MGVALLSLDFVFLVRSILEIIVRELDKYKEIPWKLVQDESPDWIN